MDYQLTNKQARQFLLLKQGLLGPCRFSGERGVLGYIRQAGCLQYDPIDVCGKNAQLVLQSRVRGFQKAMLADLLYNKRKLIDYYDKNMAIFCVEDWPYFGRLRTKYGLQGHSREQVEAVAGEVMAAVAQKGCACSADIGFKQRVDWSWSPTTLSRAALETLYFRGELILHHKKGTVKYYALAAGHLPPELLQAPDPNETEAEHLKWRVLRRIGGVGLLWNRPSDAWLGIDGLNAAARNECFSGLLEEGKIIGVTVEGIDDMLYCRADDSPLLERVLAGGRYKKRVELLAPLDNMLWDRKLIKALFDFDYKWEIYTPVPERKYGYYVLPLLAGDGLIGRAEAVCDKKARALVVKNVWYEKEKSAAKWRSGVDGCFERFAAFNGCEKVVRADSARCL